jgi:regulatory protein
LKSEQKFYSVTEARRKLERYCAYQERCHQEVEQKLLSMGMIPEACHQIMSHLMQHGFLNEGRFASSYVRSKFRQKSWGRNRLRMELKRRDISPLNIKQALSEIKEAEYLEAFESLVEKRLNQLTSEKNLQKKRRKLADYLLYRGWESGLVYDVVQDYIN